MTRLVHKQEDGFTAVEMVVTVIVMSLVTFITFGFFDSTTSLSGRASRNVQTENDAQVALRAISQDVRGANPVSTAYPSTGTCPAGGAFPSAYANCLRFALVHSVHSANFCINPEVGRVPRPYSMVTYGLTTAGLLREDRTDYTTSCTSPSRSYQNRTVLEGLTNATTSLTPTPRSLFTYFDETGKPITTLTNDAVVNAGSVTINVVLPFQRGAPELDLSTVASLRNNRGVRP